MQTTDASGGATAPVKHHGPKPSGGGSSTPTYTHTNPTALQPYTGDVSVPTTSTSTPSTSAPAPEQPVTRPDTGMLADWFMSPSEEGTIAGISLTETKDGSAKIEKPPTTEEKEKTYKPRKSFEMTWDDYLGLSDRQRAAVDFNTLIVDAREKDLTTDYTPSDQQEATYDKAVQRMFGKNGGSETYAPETLSVLEQIDFEGKGQDIDDFLGLKFTVTEKDLEKLELPQLPSVQILGVELGGSGSERIDQLTDIALDTQHLVETMAKTGSLLQDFTSSAALERNEDLQFYGGRLNRVEPTLGFGDTKDDEYFKTAFELLADSSREDTDTIFGLVQKDLGDSGQMDDFVRYVDDKTRDATLYDLDLGQAKGVKYRSPEEFRKLLQLDPVGVQP